MAKDANYTEAEQKAYDLAYEFEGKWGNCSQATMWAISKALDRDMDPAVLKGFSAFHAGGGGYADGSCGAYIAASYIVAEQVGRAVEQLGADPEDPNARATSQAMNARIGEIREEFLKEYGSVVCREIHQDLYGRQFNLKDPEDRQAFEDAGAHDWGCTSVVAKAAALAVRFLESNK